MKGLLSGQSNKGVVGAAESVPGVSSLAMGKPGNQIPLTQSFPWTSAIVPWTPFTVWLFLVDIADVFSCNCVYIVH